MGDSSPAHGSETLDFDQWYADSDGSIPRWKARRLAVAITHIADDSKVLEY